MSAVIIISETFSLYLNPANNHLMSHFPGSNLPQTRAEAASVSPAVNTMTQDQNIRWFLHYISIRSYTYKIRDGIQLNNATRSGCRLLTDDIKNFSNIFLKNQSHEM